MHHHRQNQRTAAHYNLSTGFHVRPVDSFATLFNAKTCSPCQITTKNTFIEWARAAISKGGSEYAYEKISDLATRTNDLEKHQPETVRLRINGIHFPPGCTDPLDLRILIGKTEVAHRVLIGCDFGCAALGEAFGLTTSAIKRIARERMGYSGQRSNAIVAFSGDRRWICWPGWGDAESYSIGQLMETAAGLAVLGEQQTKERQKMLPLCFGEPMEFSAFDRLADAIHQFGVDAAWDSLDKIAGIPTSQPQRQEGVFRIHDFHRPEDYRTVDDLIMVVAGTELRLGALRTCDIGCVLIQQLVFDKYAGTRRDAMLSMEKIRIPSMSGNATKGLPYKIFMDADHLYISWAPFTWWEKYSMNSLEPLMKTALSKLPPAVFRPKPHSSWIKKDNPTVRCGMCPWEYARLPSVKSTVTLAEQSRHGIPSPSFEVTNRPATTLVKSPSGELSASPPQLVHPACEDGLVAKRDSLELLRLHTTEPLPKVYEATPDKRRHFGGRLWNWILGLPRSLCFS